jgi:fatty acid desaturase
LNEETVMKRSRIIIGGIFVIISAVSLIWAISMPGNIVLPLVCFVVALVLFAGVFITGGKKWDAADNQKEGYKTYRERKAEEQQSNSQDENK